MNEFRNQDSLKTRVARGNTLAYLQKHRGKPQYRHAPKASRSVNKVLRPLARKFGPGVSSLRRQWPEIIGDKWALLSKPVAIRGPDEAKTLYIEAKGPAAAIMQADSTRILRRVNQFLGAGAITKIAVKQGRIQMSSPSKPAPTNVHETLEITQENSLQTALDKLGSKIQSNEQK